MGLNRSVKRQNFEKREEEKANRLFKMICIVLIYKLEKHMPSWTPPTLASTKSSWG